MLPTRDRLNFRDVPVSTEPTDDEDDCLPTCGTGREPGAGCSSCEFERPFERENNSDVFLARLRLLLPRRFGGGGSCDVDVAENVSSVGDRVSDLDSVLASRPTETVALT